MARVSQSELKTARDSGFFSMAGAAGLGSIGMIRASGPDAASYLQSQTTNDVDALAVGDGQIQARVSRTGHLVAWFSLHRVEEQDFILLCEADAVGPLIEAFDAYLFADQVTFEVVSDLTWTFVQGPDSATWLDGAVGPVGFEPWATLPAGAIRPLRRLKGGVSVQGWAVQRAVCGDRGFMIGLRTGQDALIEALGGQTGRSAMSPAVIDALRLEAGLPTLADNAAKPRLLPETGLEQHAVSYTKGCYLGQEVIARVRTYGSVPHALRALVFEGHPPTLLDKVPAAGEPVLREGKRIGVFGTAAWSPVLEAPVALAFLGRDHRTPGTVLPLPVGEGEIEATVAILPLYSAADTAARVQFLYDRAIKRFAREDTEGALADLREALGLDPAFADGYEAMGVLLGRTGRFHEAIDFFRRLEEVAPHEPLVNTNLSLYYMKIGDKQTAEDEAAKVVQKQFRKTLASKGKSVAEIAAAEQEARRKDAERKKHMFGQVLAFDPVDPIALFGMANALSTLGDHEEAVDHYARAAEADKKNAAVYLGHGKALEALDRKSEAIDVYKAGIEVASRRGDLMPLKEMQHRSLLLEAQGGKSAS